MLQSGQRPTPFINAVDSAMTRDPLAHCQALFEKSIVVKRLTLEACAPTIVAMAERITVSLRGGGKLMLCGNGGSAADAQHLAAELLVRLRPAVNRSPMAALALALDPSSLTACGNDYSFEQYFARMVEGLGRPGDVVLGISTSGKSGNVIAALEQARAMDIATLGFLGAGGGPAQAACDLALVVPSDETGRIQEAHITAGHALMELVEDAMLLDGSPAS
jgi:D-sedoheptulose 7-phosphate isomerase